MSARNNVKRKNMCIECKVNKQKDKYSHYCQGCFQEKLFEDYKDIRVDVPEHKYF